MKIYIYGAGEYGRQAVRRLQELSAGGTIAGIIDEYKEGNCLSYKICKIDTCRKDIPIVIAIKSGKTMMGIYEHLQSKGFNSLFWYRGESLGNSLESFFEFECFELRTFTSLLIEHLEVHLSDGCNLNCRGCTHYAPLFSPLDFPDMDKLLFDIKLLSEKVDLIECIVLMGGEPFLNAEIGEYAIRIRNMLRHSTIIVATNGLLIDQISENTLKKLKEANILVSITVYPPTREKLKEIKRILDLYGVRWELRGHVDENKFNLPLTTNSDTKLNHMCMSGNCLNLWHGKIARCPTLMYINRLNTIFDKQFPEEGIKMLHELNGTEILQLSRSSVALCKYCVENKISWDRCDVSRKESDFMTNE